MPTFPARDGQRLSYQDIGEGRPLVLLHGFMLTGAHWLDHGNAAALGRRLILPDLRAHGASPGGTTPYPKDVLADDGLALLDHLGLTDYDLGGYSLGARIVVRLLARGARPARAIVAGQGLTSINGTREGANRRVLTAITTGTPVSPADEDLAHWVRVSGHDPAALLNVLRTNVPTPDSEVATIATPTLVAVGTEDTSQATADALAATLPNATFVAVPGNHYTAMANLIPAMSAFLI